MDCVPHSPPNLSSRSLESLSQKNTPSSPNLKKILRDRHSGRAQKSCDPCRARKVRCNRQRPCHTCVKRQDQDLCVYASNTPISATFSQLTSQTGNGTGHGTLTSINSSTNAGALVGQARVGENHGSKVHPLPANFPAGGRSIAQRLTLQQGGADERQRAFETGIFPLLGIGPQVDESGILGSNIHQSGHICSSLPADQEMIELFGFYRSRVNPLQFVIHDFDDIESVVCSFLGQPIELRHCSTHFLCLLHAIMAAGSQFSDLPSDHRAALSQRHG